MFAQEEADLVLATSTEPAEVAAMVGRRSAGEPIEHVVGWAAFLGGRVRVGPPVFVPRRRTEFLALEALAALPAGAARLIELCCGAAPVATAVLAARPGAEVWAVDLDPAAVEWARVNVPAAEVLEGDLFAPLPEAAKGSIDVVVANAPYVPSAAVRLLPSEARDYESELALDGGADGLDVQRRIIAAAPDWLLPGGVLLVETGARQADATLAAMRAAGLDAAVRRDDEREATVVRGVRGVRVVRVVRGW